MIRCRSASERRCCQAKPAARRSKPCSILIAIISTAMIASSTSSPSASTSAPSEILCRPMSKCHQGEGHRQHQRDRQRHHQPGAKAQREETDQQHDGDRLGQHLDELADRARTAAGWSARGAAPGRPAGQLRRRSRHPDDAQGMSPPSRIDTRCRWRPRPKRIRAGGSAKPRGPRRCAQVMVRPDPSGSARLATDGTADTRTCTRSLGSRKLAEPPRSFAARCTASSGIPAWPAWCWIARSRSSRPASRSVRPWPRPVRAAVRSPGGRRNPSAPRNRNHRRSARRYCRRCRRTRR